MADDIKTIRAPRTKDRPYFAMARATAQDNTLTWEARGVLAYLLSKPDDWQVMIKDLQQNCGRDKARAILKELQAHNYLTVEQVHDSKGKFSRNQYRVYETPFTENPSTVNPSTVNPSTGNPTLTVLESEQNLDEQLAASAAEPQSQPAKAKTERPRNPIFDAVALGSFDLTDVSGDKTVGGRVGKIVAWLKNQPDVTAERVEAFYEWYAAENDDASAPRDAGKFAEWWLKFAEDDMGGESELEAVEKLVANTVGDVPPQILEHLERLRAKRSGGSK